MSEHYYPLVYAPRPDGACASLLRLAALGAVVGGTVAAASNLRRLQSEQVHTGAALADTGRAAVATAAATALAGAVADTLSDQGLVRLALMFATGTAVLYGIERWTEQRGGETDA
jgi:hypothetical protein